MDPALGRNLKNHLDLGGKLGILMEIDASSSGCGFSWSWAHSLTLFAVLLEVWCIPTSPSTRSRWTRSQMLAARWILKGRARCEQGRGFNLIFFFFGKPPPPAGLIAGRTWGGTPGHGGCLWFAQLRFAAFTNPWEDPSQPAQGEGEKRMSLIESDREELTGF